MLKEEQMYRNELCKKEYEKAMNEYYKECDHSYAPRLRTCNAFVYETKNYYYLRSYNTIVAIIDKTDDTLYDLLRMVYGYTATSAQHISKFEKDYSVGTYGCTRSFRYYNI